MIRRNQLRASRAFIKTKNIPLDFKVSAKVETVGE